MSDVRSSFGSFPPLAIDTQQEKCARFRIFGLSLSAESHDVQPSHILPRGGEQKNHAGAGSVKRMRTPTLWKSRDSKTVSSPPDALFLFNLYPGPRLRDTGIPEVMGESNLSGKEGENGT